MTDAAATAVPDGPEGFKRLVAEGLSILERERALCRAGQLDAAVSLAPEKEGFVARLAGVAPAALGQDASAGDRRALRAALERLVARARENERLIQAAREGVRAAARRLARLDAAQQGAVAYRADGTTILSREDAAGRSKRA